MAPSSLILTQSGLDVYTIHSQPSLYSKPTVDVHLTQVNDGQILLDRDSSAMETFLTETRTLFETSLEPKRLHAMSRHLQDEFIAKLEASHICMLPSFHHTLPKGSETGTILALDVGGSTFRLALIELTGRKASQGNDGMEIKTMKSFPIDNIVRALRGLLFFDWMAARIRDILAMDTNPIASASNPNKPLPMALSWSFPITQTSTCSGSLLEMGKGFLATAGVEGQDIGLLVASACQSLGLHVSLEAIVNDSSATLLSQAYRDPSTRISLINGTGINSAIYLPLSTLARDKIGHRGDGWWKEAKHVIVNTEISMFGRDVWDRTRWDDELNAMLPLPNFQPLEYQAGGRFLGELVRLILVEAVEKGVLFGGQMPQDLGCKYGLSTQLVGSIESDQTPHVVLATAAFAESHPLPFPRSKANLARDLQFIRSVSTFVTTRAAAYVAVAVHALWTLQHNSENVCTACSRASGASSVGDGDGELEGQGGFGGPATIACNGSIMEKYPNFRSRCQGYLDQLTVLSGHVGGGPVLEMAFESSLLGAAVAAAL